MMEDLLKKRTGISLYDKDLEKLTPEERKEAEKKKKGTIESIQRIIKR